MSAQTPYMLILLLGPVLLLPATPGTLDPSFNPIGPVPGTVTTDVSGINGLDQAVGVAVQPDNKIIAAGFGRAGKLCWALTRYLPSGALDPSFNGSGIIFDTALSTGDSYIYDVAVQPDGNIVAAGYSTSGSSHFTTVRYTPLGARDTTFGTNGVVITPNFFVGQPDAIFGLALQPDGKIVVGGLALSTPTTYGIALARYLPNGSPDQSFGTNSLGTVFIPIGSPSQAEAQDIALQPDGKIVGTGFFTNNITGFTNAIIFRLNTDGSLDTSFGTNGMTFTELPQVDILPIAIALQDDGKAIIAGQVSPTPNIIVPPDQRPIEPVGSVFVARYTCAGVLDTTFGYNGIVITSVGTQDSLANDVLVQPNGKIMIVGEAFQSNTVILLIAYNPNGTLDTSFNPFAPSPGEQPGIVLTNVSHIQDVGNSIAITPDNKLAISGFSPLQSPPGNTSFLAARYFADTQQVPPGLYSNISTAILQKYCQSGCTAYL